MTIKYYRNVYPEKNGCMTFPNITAAEALRLTEDHLGYVWIWRTGRRETHVCFIPRKGKK